MQAARKLRRRSGRDKANSFLIEGPLAVEEALQADGILSEVFWCSEEVADLARRAEQRGLGVEQVSEQVLKALSDSVTPQGIVGVGTMKDVSLSELLDGADLVLVLAEVRDPGNAGTLVRSAVAAGADGVVFTQGAADPFGPKTVRASAGTLFRTKVVRDVPLEPALDPIRASGLRLIGADAHADQTTQSTDLSGPVAVVVGNESWGLPERYADLLDERVAISMPGPVESLNVAVAGSILLFECVRQGGH